MLGHAFIHTLEETLKLLPFLFLTYLAMEYLESRAGQKTVAMLSRAGKAGPFVGGLLGVIPQCGFSAVAANLYAGGIITVGTMIAVFLSTSDEMLPILISGGAEIKEILFILGAKILVGISSGIFVDYVIRKLNNGKQRGLQIHEMCEKEHCCCEERGILKSALIHCVRIAIFIYVVLFAVHVVSEWIGMERLVETVANYPFVSIFLVGLIGLVPNCAVSIAITTLYLGGILSFGSMFAGLLACSGVGILILFKMDRDWKKNVIIVSGIYAISVLSGVLSEIIL